MRGVHWGNSQLLGACFTGGWGVLQKDAVMEGGA